MSIKDYPSYEAYIKSHEWMLKRKEALKNADYKCQRCGSAINLQVHHTAYEPEEETVVLCANCHKEIHDVGREERFRFMREMGDKRKAEEYLQQKEWAEDYISVYGILGAQSLDYQQIKDNQESLWGEIRCTAVIHSIINKLQIEKIIEMKEKGMSNYEIERQTGFSANKIRKTERI